MKYFIVSDTHSFYTALKNSLDESGYDINNPDHCFILAGDLFDRGHESAEILKFVQSIPKERRVLIRGNHEYLLRNLVKDKWYPEDYDWSNGTVFTMYQLYKMRHPKTTIFKEYKRYNSLKNIQEYYMQQDWIETQKFTNFFYYNFNVRTFHMIQNDILKSGLLDWIFSDEWVNYYDLGNYVIIHSFIPIEIPMTKKWGEFFPTGNPRYMPEWRTKSTESDWDRAMWDCPYERFDSGLFDEEKKNGKTLVCGHWHAKDFHIHYETELLNYRAKYYRNNFSNTTNEIYYGDNLIALDACTVLSGFVNVLVIDDKCEAYNQHGEKLTKELSKSKLIMTKPIIETVTVKPKE